MAKSKRKQLTDRLDEVCREVVRARDSNQCQRCHKTIKGSNSHPCHVVAKGNGASFRRWDLLNIFLGCIACHRWWHDNPTESGIWFARTFQARDGYLEMYRYGKSAKITTAEMEVLYEVLKQKLKDLQDAE